MIYIILILAFVLRLITLNQSFWLDEAISALTAQKPFLYQWTGITGDFQPPLFYLILHFFLKLGITSEWFLRIPSVVFGVLTVFVAFQFTHELFDRKTALLASILLATSQFHVYYSQELRMYSLLALLSLISMWMFFKKKWIWFSLTNIFGLYTSYIYGLIFIPQLFWLLFDFLPRWKTRSSNRNVLKKWLISLLISLIFFVPWLPNFWRQWQTSRVLLNDLPRWSALSSLPFWLLLPQLFLKFTLGRINFDNKFFYGGIFIILLILYAYILSHIIKTINKKVSFIINWFLSPAVTAVLISFFIPIAGVWRLIFLLPPFLILLSTALLRMKYSTLFIVMILTINLIANLLYWKKPEYQRENWKEAVSYIEQDERPIVFVVENGFAPYQWYKKREKLICGPKTIDNCLKTGSIYYVAYLQALFDSKNKVETKILSNKFQLQDTHDFPGVGFIKIYENRH